MFAHACDLVVGEVVVFEERGRGGGEGRGDGGEREEGY